MKGTGKGYEPCEVHTEVHTKGRGGKFLWKLESPAWKGRSGGGFSIIFTQHLSRIPRSLLLEGAGFIYMGR